MKKIKVIIEESKVKQFEIEVEETSNNNAMEKAMSIAEKDLKDGKIIINDSDIVYHKMMAIDEENDVCTEWIEI